MSVFDIFTHQLVNGIVLGSFYALVALGYTMVFGVVKLLNFAHGDLYMVGGFAGFLILSFIVPFVGPGWLGVAVSMVFAMIAVMILKPGGLFPNREIGHILTRARRKKETTP